MIRALSQVHGAVSAINAEGGTDILGRLTAFKNAKFEVEAAARTIAPFASTDNESRRTASDSLATGFAMLLKSFETSITLYEKVDEDADLKEMRALASDSLVQYKQATKMMVAAAGSAVASAVVPDPADPANGIALAITAADRAALLKMLTTGFGGKLVKTIGDTGPANAAKAMLDTLGQDWRLAPGK